MTLQRTKNDFPGELQIPDEAYRKLHSRRAAELIKGFIIGSENNMRAFLERKIGKEIVGKHLAPFALTALGG